MRSEIRASERDPRDSGTHDLSRGWGLDCAPVGAARKVARVGAPAPQTRAPDRDELMKAVGKETALRNRGRLAHVEEGGRTYFLTFSAIRGNKLRESERQIVMASCKYGHPGQWILHGAVVMPDHVHMLLTPQRIINGAGALTRAISPIIPRISAASV